MTPIRKPTPSAPRRWWGAAHDLIMASATAAALLLLYWEAQLPKEPAVAQAFGRLDHAILAVFCADALVRLLLAKDKRRHLRLLAVDLIVVFPIVHLFQGLATARWFFLIRQAALLVAATRPTRPMQAAIRFLYRRPAQMLILSFVFAIAAGTLLLLLPMATPGPSRMPFVDAVFTATSATCVTGLTVLDTGAGLTPFGQLVVLGLIQVGGLGIMTFSIWVLVITGKRLDPREQMVMHETLAEDTITGIVDRLRFIVRMTLIVEALGALVLWGRWWPRYGAGRGFYLAVFHSISAFCNAGFSLFSNNLESFADDGVVNGTIGLLIIIGGLGFVVVRDLTGAALRRDWEGRSRHLLLQTRVVLRTSLTLIVLGAVVLLLAEHDRAFQGLPVEQRILRATFQSVTARTAGFNTISIGALTHASLFAIILLMFIGASPGSTGGGIKTTTLWTLVRYGAASLRGLETVQSHHQEIPAGVVQKAVAVVVIAAMVLSAGTFGLMLVESQPFHHVLFEATSAFGTVGLSCGITPSLTRAGKVILTFLMLIGRLGPLTVALGLARRPRVVRVRYPTGRLMIG